MLKNEDIYLLLLWRKFCPRLKYGKMFRKQTFEKNVGCFKSMSTLSGLFNAKIDCFVFCFASN